MLALGMAIQPNAPIGECRAALLHATQLSLADPMEAQLAAAAMGCLVPGSATSEEQARLSELVAAEQGMPVRILAAHAMFRLKCLPSTAVASICQMLTSDDANARKVALLCFGPFARTYRSAIGAQIGRTSPDQWTTEGLQALAMSTDGDSSAQQTIDAYLMRSVANAPLVPTGVAVYAALVRINPKSSALTALVQTACAATEPAHWRTALEALSGLGESAKPAARQLAEALVATDDPVRQEAICRTLVAIRAGFKELPVQYVVQRVRDAAVRSAAAHCLLLCLCPKEFAPAATIVRQRFVASEAALKAVLAQTYKTLTGTELTVDADKSGD